MMLNKKDMSTIKRVLMDEVNDLERLAMKDAQKEARKKRAMGDWPRLYSRHKATTMAESIRIVLRKLDSPQGCW